LELWSAVFSALFHSLAQNLSSAYLTLTSNCNWQTKSRHEFWNFSLFQF